MVCQIFVQILYSEGMGEPGHLRIGELSRRTGASVDLLRAWEKRYGLLDPDRSEGGFRLYSDDDVARVRAMQAHLVDGLAAAEAARRALENGGPEAGGGDLVAWIFGLDFGQTNAASRIVYGLVGLAAVYGAARLPALRRNRSARTSRTFAPQS